MENSQQQSPNQDSFYSTNGTGSSGKPITEPTDVYSEQISLIPALVYLAVIAVFIYRVLLTGDEPDAGTIFTTAVLIFFLVLVGQRAYRVFLQQIILKRPFLRIDQSGLHIGYPGSSSAERYNWDQIAGVSVFGLKRMKNLNTTRILGVRLLNPPKLSIFKKMFNNSGGRQIKDDWLLIPVVSHKGRPNFKYSAEELVKIMNSYSSGRITKQASNTEATEKLPKGLASIPVDLTK